MNRWIVNGTKNKDLKTNADGSVTIYVQADSPGADKEANWLPAPAGEDFSLYIRAYWPEAAIAEGNWTPPAVERQGSHAAPGVPSDQDITDAYVYLLGRLLVLRQERLDFEKDGFEWNKLFYREPGGVTWAADSGRSEVQSDLPVLRAVEGRARRDVLPAAAGPGEMRGARGQWLSRHVLCP